MNYFKLIKPSTYSTALGRLRATTRARKAPALASREAAGTVECFSLKLDTQESAAFEKWAREPSRPTEYMVEVAKAHQALQKRS